MPQRVIATRSAFSTYLAGASLEAPFEARRTLFHETSVPNRIRRASQRLSFALPSTTRLASCVRRRLKRHPVRRDRSAASQSKYRQALECCQGQTSARPRVERPAARMTPSTMPVHPAWRTLAASALLSAALIAATLALFDPFFTNDGAVMAMIASGTGVARQPDEHLVFTNVLLGRVVAALYRRSPEVPWYGLHLVGAQAVAWTGLFGACLARGVTARRVALCVLAYAVVGIGLLVNLQVSSTAFLVALAGGCGWTVMATDEGARGWGAGVASILLMVLGSLERFDPFLLVLALAGVSGVTLAGGRPGRRWLIVGASAILLALAARAYDRHVYEQDAGWASF